MSVPPSLKNPGIFQSHSLIYPGIFTGTGYLAFTSILDYEKKSQLEIDFILNIDGVVTALEVKSGNNKQSKSLNSIVENYKTVSRYIKLEKDTNIYVDKLGIEHYPLFMIMFI